MFKVCKIEAGKLLNNEEKFLLYGVSDPEQPEDHTIIFVKGNLAEDYGKVENSIFITNEQTELNLSDSCVHLKSSTPKNLYGELLEKMKALIPEQKMQLVNGSYVSEDVQIGAGTTIAPFCIIGKDVVIGANCEIGTGVVIKDHVRIGNEVQIREHCMIGVEDADIYRTKEGYCRTLPHLAGTIIEDGCLLLAGAVLAAGDTRTTVLGAGAMIGLVGDVGHNCRIGSNTLVSGKSSISGHCNVGEHVYVAPMAVTTNRIDLGDQSYLGIGAVAIKDVPEGEKQFGNPARKVLEMKKK
jgi:UDP-3-O-[3-hydroxymyristoyl] glucosamine N-acyltransferase